METFLQDIDSSEIKHFFKHICIVSNNPVRKKRHFDVKKKYVEPKKMHELAKIQRSAEKELKDNIPNLEYELQHVRKERDKAVGENREQIQELNVAVLSVKTKLHNYIEEKKERARRMKELEEKIRRKVR